MNFNIDLYNKTEAKEFGDYETLELGGHEIVIVDAREYTSEISGKTSLKISVDVSVGDKQAGFFKRRYDESVKTDPNAKWPSGATKYVSLSDEQLAYLKGFITSLEKSNANFKFNTKGTWEQLKGLKCAGQFGLEEYTKQDGTLSTATKLVQFRSMEKLSEITIPKVKKLDGSLVDYNEYINEKNDTQSFDAAKDLFDNSVVELPF